MCWVVYGRYARQRLRFLAQYLPERGKVLEVCAGPALLYPYVAAKKCEYLGLDLSLEFVQHGLRKKIPMRLFNLNTDTLPGGYTTVVMQNALYQFHDDAPQILGRLLTATSGIVILSEPVVAWASSKNRLLKYLGVHFTNPGTGIVRERFDQASLERLVGKVPCRVIERRNIPGGREILYVLTRKGC